MWEIMIVESEGWSVFWYATVGWAERPDLGFGSNVDLTRRTQRLSAWFSTRRDPCQKCRNLELLDSIKAVSLARLEGF
jgi:hypothetical protein